MNLERFRRLLHEDIFELFRKRKAISPNEDPSSFGNIALRKGFITESVLKGSVLVQHERLKLGEILMSMGHITARQCDEVLVEQDKMRAKTPADKVGVEMKYHRKLMGQASKGLAKMSDTGEFAIPEKIQKKNGRA